MRKKHVLVALILCVHVVHHANAQVLPSTTPAPRQRLHNPNLPYKVWVVCLDTSLSLQPEQFRRLQVVAEEIVRRDVAPNDLVFLIQIQSGFGFTEPFQMPVGTTLASRKPEAARALSNAKADVIAAILRMKQNSRTTDLQSSLDVAFDLLGQQPRATQRLLIMGTDYLTDNGSANPNPPISPIRAAGVDALLLVAYPKPEYLRGLRLGASSLLRIVETKWSAHFEDGGAHSVSVRLVDTAYASTQGSSNLR
jgi:hypothetical protein